MDRLLQDVRFAVRSLVRSPGFTAVALLTLALGIGVNVAMFSIVNGVLLRPLPYAEPDQLVRLYQASREQGVPDGRISAPDLEDWRERTHSFAALAGYMHLPQILTARGDALEIWSAYVTDDFFRVLGAPVALGRPLTEEDTRRAVPNAVISDRLWRTRFAADPGVIGRSIVLGGRAYTVVGVARASFPFPTPNTDVWAPHALLTALEIGPRVRDNRNLEGVARLREGVSPEQAQADLGAVAGQLAADYPASNAEWGAASVVPLRTVVVGDVDTALVVVMGVVGFILLIGCANLANLLLARGSGRSREIAIRTTLGAVRGRIVGQFLTESLVLALLGGVLGLLFSTWGVQVILAMSADTLPRVQDVRVDGLVFVFGLLLSVFTGILFGLLPALRASRIDPQQPLRGGRGSIGDDGQRLRNALVVAQVTLSVVLVMGAGLMARSFVELRRVDPGFDPEGVLTASMQLNLAGVQRSEILDHIRRRREAIVQQTASLPGVVAAGLVNSFPLEEETWEVFEFVRSDGVGSRDGAPLRADRSFVSSGYFRAMGIPLLRGDPLPDEVAPGAPLPFLINEAAARRFWPGENPVGQIVTAGSSEAVVVGVVGDVRHLGLAQEPTPAAYFPQRFGPRISSTLVVRTAGDPQALAGPVRQMIRELDPNQPIRSVATLRNVMAESISRDRFFTVLFAVFGGLALALAALGIYGVLAYSITRRTKEIGVRMALGARAADVLRTTVGGGMLLVGAGIVLGTIAALLLTRVLESQLYGVGATDPVTFAAVPAVLAGVALLAGYLPARRATRVDPLVALRDE